MARRDDSILGSTFEQSFELFRMLPWWAAPIGITVILIVFYLIVPALPSIKGNMWAPLGIMFGKFFAVVVCVAVGIGGFVSLLETLKKKVGNRNIATTELRPSSTSVSQPLCPKCNATMILRTARQGTHAGQQFWGCPNYPDCRGTRQV